MAMNVIDVTLKLIDQLSQPLQEANAKLMDSGRKWQRVGKQIEGTGKSITNVGKTLTTAVTVPIVGAATVCVNSFEEVDKTMRLTQQTMGATETEAQMMFDAMATAASNSTFTMQDAATGMLNYARAGFDAAEASDMIAPSMDLAVGTATDLGMVTEGLGSTMKVFGAEASEATEYANYFARAQAMANTTVTDLFNSMGHAGAMFETVGWNVKDLAVATGVLGDAFIGGSEAGTAFKSGLARLTSNEKATEELDRLGISITNADGSYKSFIETQKLLHDAFEGMTEAEKTQSATLLFGTNQMAKWLSLVKRSPADIAEMEAKMVDASTSAYDMAQAMMTPMEKLKSSLNVLATTFGQTMMPYLQKAIDFIQQLVDKFNALDPKQRDQIVRWAAIAAAVGPALMVFGKTVTGIGQVVGAVGKFGSALKNGVSAFAKFSAVAGNAGNILGALKAGFVAFAGPGAIVVAVLGAIVVATVLVIKHWDQIKAAAQALWDKVTTVFTEIRDRVSEAMQNAGLTLDNFKQKFQPVIDAVKRLWSAMQELWAAVQPILAAIGQAFVAMWNAVKPILQAFVTFMVNVWQSKIVFVFETAVAVIKIFWDTLVLVCQIAISSLEAIITFLTAVFTGNWEEAWDHIGEIFRNLWQGVCDWFGGIVETITGWLNGLLELIGSVLEGLAGVAGAFAEGGFSGAVNYIVGGNANGTDNWRGGLTAVNEKGGEIIDLPRGSRVYPHDKSVAMAYQQGQAESNRSVVINIPKLADSISVRSSSDIDAIAQAIADKLEKVAANVGDSQIGYAY